MAQEKIDYHLHPDVFPKGKHMSDILPSMLENMQQNYAKNPNQVFLEWNKAIGEEIAKMAVPILYKDKTLYIKVNNSTLLSILERQEKLRLLDHLKKVCPQSGIQNIIFKVG